MHTLLAQIEQRLVEPDAGLWELRNQQHLHTFTLLTHWAGARRAADIGRVISDRALLERGTQIAKRARAIIMERCWNERIGALTQHADTEHLDAATLLALHFGFFRKEDPRAQRHVDAIRSRLQIDGMLRRYSVEDDFGEQEAAFTVCSFWLAEALGLLGREAEARELFEHVLSMGNDLHLFSEDIVTQTGELSGNFPQTYSHVGLLNVAFRLSRPWD